MFIKFIIIGAIENGIAIFLSATLALSTSNELRGQAFIVCSVVWGALGGAWTLGDVLDRKIIGAIGGIAVSLASALLLKTSIIECTKFVSVNFCLSATGYGIIGGILAYIFYIIIERFWPRGTSWKEI